MTEPSDHDKLAVNALKKMAEGSDMIISEINKLKKMVTDGELSANDALNTMKSLMNGLPTEVDEMQISNMSNINMSNKNPSTDAIFGNVINKLSNSGLMPVSDYVIDYVSKMDIKSSFSYSPSLEGSSSGSGKSDLQQMADMNGVSVSELEKILNAKKVPSSGQTHTLNYYEGFTLEKVKKVVEQCGDPNLIKIKITEGSNNSYSILDGFITILLNYGFQETQRDKYFDVIKYAVKWGLDVNKKDKHKSAPIYYACNNGSSTTNTLLDILIDAGADINIGNRYESTPLQTAAAKHNYYAITQLVLNGANIDAKMTQERSELKEYMNTDIRCKKAVTDGLKLRGEREIIAINASHNRMIKTNPTAFLEVFDIQVTI